MKHRRDGVVQEAFLEGMGTTKHSFCTRNAKLILHWEREDFYRWIWEIKAAGTQEKAWTETWAG